MRQSTRLVFVLLIQLVIVVSCQRENAVSLAVDFTSQDVWNYSFTGEIGGSFSYNDSSSMLSSTITCNLSGRKTENRDQLTLKAENVRVVSNILDTDEIQYVTDQIEKVEYSVALNIDISNPQDSLLVPVSGFHEWDLYRQLIKVIPSLPESQVRPGFSWEREKRFPVTTSQGETTCEVYQSFTFDSLRTAGSNHKEACISWQFRYAIDDAGLDTASQISSLPLAGNGNGTALIDVTRKCLVSTEMVFTTPASSLPDVSVQWKEKASLMLTDTKTAKQE